MMSAVNKQEGPEDFASGPSCSNAVIRDYWEWSYLGLCKKPSLAKLFRDGKTKEAKVWCDVCPVKQDCLYWAVIYKEKGVWGGTTVEERNKLFDTQKREKLITQSKLQGTYYVQQSPGSLLQQQSKRRAGR